MLDINRESLASNIAYRLRLLVAAARFLQLLPVLLRLAARDAGEIVALRSQLTAHGALQARRWSGTHLSHPLRACHHLAVSLPTIAGKAQDAFAGKIRDMHEYFRRESDATSAPRVRLYDPGVLELKKKHLIRQFRVAFGLNVLDREASVFARYVRTGELFRDFLDFALSESAVDSSNIRDILASALVKFAERMKELDVVALGLQLPPRGAFVRAKLPPASLWSSVWATDFSMVGYYDRTRTLTSRFDVARSGQILRRQLHGHIAEIEGMTILGLRAVILCEAHLLCCLALLSCQQEARGGPSEPLERALRRARSNLIRIADRAGSALGG